MGDKMNKQLPLKETFALGFFMFALFLGAGNLIFPPLLGQQAGTSIWYAIVGFLVTGVGLPILAIITISQVAGNIDEISKRVHPIFATVFPFIIYLSIGPFFGIPRTGTVAYEIGVVPFLAESSDRSLLISTLLFFTVTYWVALNPSKLVERVGKILTPILLVAIVIISIKSVITPLGEIGEPTIKYREGAFTTGFIEGFLTMDAIAALAFGIVVIHRIQERGISSIPKIRNYTIKAGLIAGLALSLVYLSLAYIGSTSVQSIGMQDNGGQILSAVTSQLFGSLGTILLSIVITSACLTTSIGLVSACGEFLHERFRRLPYPVIIAVICLFSFTMANLGLNQLISVSLPILIAIYPITIVLIVLSLLHSYIKIPRTVYIGAMSGAGLVSIVDGLVQAGFHLTVLLDIYSHLPFFDNGVGWLVPSIVGACIGFFYGMFQKTK